MEAAFGLSQVSGQVWIQAIARGLYQLGSAVLLFYIPIVFVNYGGLTASDVGLAIGGGSLVGFLGNLLGGGMADSQRFGRQGTLIVSAVLAILTSVITLIAHDFRGLLAANILFGLSVGLYWTAADSAIMDSTTPEQRQSAFSVVGVMDNLGFGLGTLGGGLLLEVLQPKTWIFAASVFVFGLFLLLVAIAVIETRQPDLERPVLQTGWKQALSDGQLMTYLLVNTQFVMFLALVGSTLPLYFVNFLGTSEPLVANLFTWGYVALGAGLQVPLIRLLAKFSYLRSLMLSMLIWGIGFGLIWVISASSSKLVWSELGVFAIFAIATIIYKPTSSAWISKLAPESLRGVYTAIAYQCWSLGYVFGPILGGWAMDQSRVVAHNFWLGVAVSTVMGVGILQVLDYKRERLVSELDQST
jgi:MFS family permease